MPLAPWPDDPKMREIGRIRGMAMNQGVEGYSLALYTRYLGWSADELRVLLAKVRSEFNDLNNRMYIAVYVLSLSIDVSLCIANGSADMWSLGRNRRLTINELRMSIYAYH